MCTIHPFQSWGFMNEPSDQADGPAVLFCSSMGELTALEQACFGQFGPQRIGHLHPGPLMMLAPIGQGEAVPAHDPRLLDLNSVDVIHLRFLSVFVEKEGPPV